MITWPEPAELDALRSLKLLSQFQRYAESEPSAKIAGFVAKRKQRMSKLMLLFTILVASLIAANGWAQQKWEHLTPPTNEDFFHVAVLNSSTVVIATRHEPCRMYRSVDRGQSWKEIPIPGFVIEITDLEARDDKLYVHLTTIPTGIPNLWISTDLGDTWRKTTFEWAGPAALHLLNSNIIYAAHERPNSNKIWRSTDDGLSWTFSEIPGGNVTCIHFADTLTGMLALDRSPIGSDVYVTLDSGKSWQYSNHGANVVLCLEDSIWLAGEGVIDRSFDTGKTWIEGTKYYYFIRALKPYRQKEAFAIGRDGVLYSASAGKDWVYVDSFESLSDLDVEGNSVYACGYGGRLTRLVSVSDVEDKGEDLGETKTGLHVIACVDGWLLMDAVDQATHIFDQLGRLIMSYSPNVRFIPRESLARGQYFIVNGSSVVPVLVDG